MFSSGNNQFGISKYVPCHYAGTHKEYHGQLQCVCRSLVVNLFCPKLILNVNSKS